MKQTPHIIYIITKLELGGAQKVCLEIFNGQTSATLVTGTEGKLVPKVAEKPNVILLKELTREVRFFGLLNEIKCFIKLISTLRALKKKYSHVIVHTHSTKAGLLGRWAAFFAGIKTRIHTIHGFAFHDHQNKITWFLIYATEWITSLITTHFVCVSSADVKTGIKLFPKFESKHSIIRAAIDFGQFVPAQKIRLNPFLSFASSGRTEDINQKPCSENIKIINTTRPDTSISSIENTSSINSSIELACPEFIKLAKDPKPFIFGTIACFKPQKNLFDLLQAFHHVYKKNPYTRLEIIGDGQLRPAIESWIFEHKLNKVITLHGWQDHVALIMMHWHAFALTSLWEGLPCAVVEARLQKLPVISYNTGGIHDVILHGENGLLYPQKEWQKMAAGMIELTRNNEFYEKLKNYQDQLGDFKIEAMVEEHRQLYRRFNASLNRLGTNG